MNEFDAFIESAWQAHAEQTREVADRLAASLQRVETPDQVARYAGLVSHVYGEHLGDTGAGIALLERLGASAAAQGQPEAQRAIARHVAALRHVAGDSTATAELDIECHEDEFRYWPKHDRKR